MSVISGANPTDSGLVFHYDTGNTKKSWRGAPTTNLLGSYQDLSANWAFAGGGSAVLNSAVLPNGLTGVSSYTITDTDAAGYSYITKSVTVPNDSATYIISIYIKKTFGNALAKCGFNIIFYGGTSGGTYVRMNPNDGSITGGVCVSIDDTWWRWSVPVTNNSTGNTTLTFQFFPATGLISGGDTVAATGSVIAGGIQLETGSFATPFVAGARTNTQSIVDLTGNNTITANSLTYNSDGTFKFLQSGGGYISTGTNFNTVMTGTQSFTIECWVNPDATQVAHSDICGVHSPDGIVVQQNNLTMNQYYFCFSIGGNVFKYSYFNLTPSVYNHLVITKNSTYTSVWVNGTRAAYNNYTEAIVTNSSPFMVGNGIGSTDRCFNGRIPVFKVYNRELSSGEIQQNFYSLRSRFGV